MISNETKSRLKDMINWAYKHEIKEEDPINIRADKYKNFLENSKHMIGEFDFDDDALPILQDLGLLTVDSKTYVFESGYVPWLNGARNDIDFKFYERYENYLLDKKKWSPKSVGTINNSSDIILDHMRNPKTKDTFICKGLVIGDIQSGKTANYSALINKALDVGYKLIIIFTGTTNDLRKQTQFRVDSEILGYETKEDATHGKSKGVSEYGSKNLVVDCLTYDDTKGDFKGSKGVHSLTSSSTPVVAVVKKQTSVLANLYNFVSGMQENCYTNDKLDIPVLIIDDESDLASVDTKDGETYEDASAINRGIRKIIYKLNRCSYVAYTATPFANVFIDPYYQTPEGRDLYPEDFIICIPTPYNYCGVQQYFSLSSNPEDEGSRELCRIADDFSDFFDMPPLRISKDTKVDKIAKSLEDALINFIIAASIKKQRGIIEHNSMLIHIASVKCPSTTLTELVKEKINDMYNAYKYDKEEKNRYRQFWEENIKNTSEFRLGDLFDDKWENIEPFIAKTFGNLMLGGIKLLNGDSADVINYSDLEPSDFIVIGGNKLSRGLTLEGLIISYFLRNSKQYDALLQMGRWFGYRDGWLDLCRIYTTENTIQNFMDIGVALCEFRTLIEDMNNNDKNPLNFGLMVRTCPNLIPTARNKMKTVQRMFISYSGKQSQTTMFDPEAVNENFETTVNFVDSLKNPKILKNNKVVFKNVEANDVINYLDKYNEAPDYQGNANVKYWINYIKKSIDRGEMKDWSIILTSLTGNEGSSCKVGKYEIIKPKRNDRDAVEGNPIQLFKLRVSTNPKDFKDALYDIDDLQDVDTFSSSNPKIIEHFTKEKAILSIQVMDVCYMGEEYRVNNSTRHRIGKEIENGHNIVALTMWFPKSDDVNTEVEYYITKVKQFEMEGASLLDE